MRELKFRAWSDEQKRFIFFDLWDLDCGHAEDPDDEGVRMTVVQGLPVEQYTGLKDKNGKEIYEGDIVEIASTYDDGSGPVMNAGTHLEVRWGMWNGGDSECETWILVNDQYPEYGTVRGIDSPVPLFEGSIYNHPVVVIGNIHENQDLLPKSAA